MSRELEALLGAQRKAEELGLESFPRELIRAQRVKVVLEEDDSDKLLVRTHIDCETTEGSGEQLSLIGSHHDFKREVADFDVCYVRCQSAAKGKKGAVIAEVFEVLVLCRKQTPALYLYDLSNGVSLTYVGVFDVMPPLAVCGDALKPEFFYTLSHKTGEAHFVNCFQLTCRRAQHCQAQKYERHSDKSSAATVQWSLTLLAQYALPYHFCVSVPRRRSTDTYTPTPFVPLDLDSYNSRFIEPIKAATLDSKDSRSEYRYYRRPDAGISSRSALCHCRSLAMVSTRGSGLLRVGGFHWLTAPFLLDLLSEQNPANDCMFPFPPDLLSLILSFLPFVCKALCGLTDAKMVEEVSSTRCLRADTVPAVLSHAPHSAESKLTAFAKFGPLYAVKCAGDKLSVAQHFDLQMAAWMDAGETTDRFLAEHFLQFGAERLRLYEQLIDECTEGKKDASVREKLRRELSDSLTSNRLCSVGCGQQNCVADDGSSSVQFTCGKAVFENEEHFECVLRALVQLRADLAPSFTVSHCFDLCFDRSVEDVGDDGAVYYYGLLRLSPWERHYGAANASCDCLCRFEYPSAKCEVLRVDDAITDLDRYSTFGRKLKCAQRSVFFLNNGKLKRVPLPLEFEKSSSDSSKYRCTLM